MRRILLMLALAAAVAWAAPSVRAQDGKVHMLWLGHATWRITTPGGKIIVIDPWLVTNPKTPPEYKNLDKIGKMDVILVTHGHFDHIADAPALAKKYNVPIWATAGLNQQLVDLGVIPAELAPRFRKGGTITPIGPNIKITAVHSEHEGEFVFKDESGKEHSYYGGEPMGYIITLENGLKIYHMGDTALFGDMALIGSYYHPDIVLIPIGGNYGMDPEAAAYAVKNFLKPAHAIPMHYGTRPELKGTPEEFIKALGDAPTKVHVMKPGDTITF
jgi:L-ascorbate metabolism protein UlaG (beta-lactamase superfamily)